MECLPEVELIKKEKSLFHVKQLANVRDEATARHDKTPFDLQCTLQKSPPVYDRAFLTL
jgi:hypothetical protein